MILVIGGAGYIGSHFVKELVETKEVIVLDNLSTGHLAAIDRRARFIEGDLGDVLLLRQIFKKYSIEAVVHFAAFSLVGESVEQPLKYYENNVLKTTILLKEMLTSKGYKGKIRYYSRNLRFYRYKCDDARVYGIQRKLGAYIALQDLEKHDHGRGVKGADGTF